MLFTAHALEGFFLPFRQEEARGRLASCFSRCWNSAKQLNHTHGWGPSNSYGQECVFLFGSAFVPGGIVFHPHKGNSCLSHSQVTVYDMTIQLQ